MVSYLGVVRTVMMADTAQFNRAVRGASAEFRAAAQKMQHDAKSLVAIGGALNLGITVPALFAARSITRAGTAYASQMMKIRQITGQTREEFERFSRDQRDIAYKAATPREELAKVAYIAAQGQIIDPSAIKAFQTSVAKAQHVLPGDAPVEVVAEGFRTVLNSFKISVEEFEPVMAQLVKTIDLGSISWREYAKTIPFVASISAATGTPEALKSMNLALAVATQQGGQTGARAARSLRSLYTSIYKTPTDASRGLASQLGYKDFADMFERGAGADLITFLKMIPESMRNLKSFQGLGLMQQNITAALAIANAPEEIIASFRERYDKALDDFKSRYKEAQNNPAYIMEQLAAAWSDLKLEFFKSLGPTFIAAIKKLTSAIKMVADTPDAIKKLAAGIVALGAVTSLITGFTGVFKTVALVKHLGLLAPLAPYFRLRPTEGSKIKQLLPTDIIPGAKGWHDVLPRKGGKFGKLSPEQRTLGEANMAARIAQGSKTIWSLLGMLLKVGAIVYIVVSAFRGLWNVLKVTLVPVLGSMVPSMESVSEVFKTIWEWIKRIDDLVVQGSTLAFAGVIGTLENIFGAIIGGTMNAWNAIRYSWTQLKIWVLDNALGRALGISVSDEEREEWKKLQASRLESMGEWGSYAWEQLKGVVGGEESALLRILQDLGTPEGKEGGAPSKLTPIFGRPLAEDREDPTEAFVKELFGVGGAAGLFEAGTASGYEALVTANDALLQMMREFKDKNIEKLGTISDGLGEIAATLEEIGIDGDITVEGAV